MVVTASVKGARGGKIRNSYPTSFRVENCRVRCSVVACSWEGGCNSSKKSQESQSVVFELIFFLVLF